MRLTFTNSFSSIHLIIFLVLLLTFEETLGYHMGGRGRRGRNRRHLGSHGSSGLGARWSSTPLYRSARGRQNGINRSGR